MYSPPFLYLCRCKGWDTDCWCKQWKGHFPFLAVGSHILLLFLQFWLTWHNAVWTNGSDQTNSKSLERNISYSKVWDPRIAGGHSDPGWTVWRQTSCENQTFATVAWDLFLPMMARSPHISWKVSHSPKLESCWGSAVFLWGTDYLKHHAVICSRTALLPIGPDTAGKYRLFLLLAMFCGCPQHPRRFEPAGHPHLWCGFWFGTRAVRTIVWCDSDLFWLWLSRKDSVWFLCLFWNLADENLDIWSQKDMNLGCLTQRWQSSSSKRFSVALHCYTLKVLKDFFAPLVQRETEISVCLQFFHPHLFSDRLWGWASSGFWCKLPALSGSITQEAAFVPAWFLPELQLLTRISKHLQRGNPLFEFNFTLMNKVSWTARDRNNWRRIVHQMHQRCSHFQIDFYNWDSYVKWKHLFSFESIAWSPFALHNLSICAGGSKMGFLYGDWGAFSQQPRWETIACRSRQESQVPSGSRRPWGNGTGWTCRALQPRLQQQQKADCLQLLVVW